MPARNIVGKHIISSTENPLQVIGQTSYLKQVSYCCSTQVNGWRVYIRDGDSPQKVAVLLDLSVSGSSGAVMALEGKFFWEESIQMLSKMEIVTLPLAFAIGGGTLDVWLSFDTAPPGSQ